jgi:SUKH superfamily protein
MYIEQLLAVLTPPRNLFENTGAPWPIIEEEVGLRLPDDYKSFIMTYGSGRISRFLWVLNPFSANRNINLMSQVEKRLQSLRTLNRDFGERCPYSLFPVKGGLLPCAITDNGDVVYWITDGQPSYWRIVVNEARGPRYELFEDGLVSFLVRLLTRMENCAIFPKSFPDPTPSFEPV